VENPKVLLQITSSLESSLGGPTFLVQSSSKFMKKFFSSNKVLIFGKLDVELDCEYIVMPTWRNNRYGLPASIKLREIRKSIQQSNFVLVHGFYLFSTLITVCLSNSHTIFIMPHGSMEPYQEKFRKFRKIFFRLLFRVLCFRKRIIFMVASSREIIGVQKLFPTKDVQLAGYGISFPSKEINFRNVPEKANFVIGSLSRLHTIKRIDLAIKCMPNLVSQGLGPRLRIAGEGNPNLLTKLKLLAISLGVESRVDFIGEVWQESKEQFFNEIDVLILLSDNENFAIVVGEAVIRGIPVVVRSTVAMSDFVAEWDLGVVVVSDEIRDISAAVTNVIGNYSYYSANCFIHRQRLGWDQVGSAWNSIMSSQIRRKIK